MDVFARDQILRPGLGPVMGFPIFLGAEPLAPSICKRLQGPNQLASHFDRSRVIGNLRGGAASGHAARCLVPPSVLATGPDNGGCHRNGGNNREGRV